MKEKVKISILAIAVLIISAWVFTSCNKNDVSASNSLDAISLMQKAAADAVPPAFDTTMCHGHGNPHGGPPGSHVGNDSLFTHTKLAQADLPAAIATYISTNYAGATFKDAVKIVLKSSGAVQAYLVLLNNNSTAIGLRFDGTGKFIDAHTGPAGKAGDPHGPPPGGPGPH